MWNSGRCRCRTVASRFGCVTAGIECCGHEADGTKDRQKEAACNPKIGCKGNKAEYSVDM